MADGTSVVSDRWGTSAGPRALRERSQYASRLRLPAAAENRRNCSQVSPCAGRLPSGRGPNADRPFDEPTTSTARRVAAATWMMSSTTVASRAYAVVPARRSRWSRGGASRPGSAPAAGSARHRADASRRDRAARSPDPQPASCRRSFRRGFRARAAPSTRHRWCPRPDQQPLSGCVGRDVLAGACVPNPGAGHDRYPLARRGFRVGELAVAHESGALPGPHRQPSTSESPANAAAGAWVPAEPGAASGEPPVDNHGVEQLRLHGYPRSSLMA